MYLFDTNAYQLLIDENLNIVRRYEQYSAITRLSSVSAEEMLTGRLSKINKARSAKFALSVPLAHEDFALTLVGLQLMEIHVYSPEAEAICRTFDSKKTRLGSQDCRIAAQALAHGFTVITRNLSDFEGIGATCVDWSR